MKHLKVTKKDRPIDFYQAFMFVAFVVKSLRQASPMLPDRPFAIKLRCLPKRRVFE